MSENTNSNDNFFGDPQSSETGENGGASGGGINQLSDNQVGTTGGIISQEPMNEDADILDIKQRVKGMDEEAARLIQLQSEMEQQMKSTSSPTASFGGAAYAGFLSAEEKMEVDSRSIYVGNVDYSATAQELEAHFHGCGSINRVTILCDKFTGHPKGFAYVEFGDKDAIQTAMALDESLFKGRQIKVVCKRTNKPGISSTDRFPRGRGAAAAGVGGFRGRGSMYGHGAARGGAGFSPYMRGTFRGRVFRGARGFYSPYAPY